MIRAMGRELQDQRDSELANITFYISSSGHLCHHFNRKILSVAMLRLQFCSISGGKSDLNLSVKLGTSANSKSLSYSLIVFDGSTGVFVTYTLAGTAAFFLTAGTDAFTFTAGTAGLTLTAGTGAFFSFNFADFSSRAFASPSPRPLSIAICLRDSE
jgi:hypothetical protein